VSLAARLAVALLLAAAFALPLRAQDATITNPSPPRLPNQFDPHLRLPAARIAAATPIRFLTDDDYPPFQVAGPDGNPSGFNVDLARAICEELKHQCVIQQRRWDTLLAALADGSGDAVIAGMKSTPDILARADVTLPYIKLPARFVARTGNAVVPSPQSLAGKTVAVAQGTAHEAYLEAFFPAAELRRYPAMDAALQGLSRGEAELAFVDGATAATWLARASGACCAFVGGPYLESRYFGEGMVIAVRKGDDALRHVLDSTLQTLSENGRLGDIYLRYFPIGFY
jgi:polar amino acid transport system substrate-binding protein